MFDLGVLLYDRALEMSLSEIDEAFTRAVEWRQAKKDKAGKRS